jgi:hypothetical protein
MGIMRIRYPTGKRSILNKLLPRRKYINPMLVIMREYRRIEGSNEAYPINRREMPAKKIKIPLESGSIVEVCRTSRFFHMR